MEGCALGRIEDSVGLGGADLKFRKGYETWDEAIISAPQ